MLIQNTRKGLLTIGWLIILLFSLMFSVTYSHATQQALQPPDDQPGSDDALSIDTLNGIVSSIKQQKLEIDKKLVLLQQSKTEQEKSKFQAEIDDASRSIAEQKSSFEMILTGGQELVVDDTSKKEAFDINSSDY